MCKGKPPGTPSAVLRAGEIVNVQFEGSARHGGGLCQFAISYDNDKTFNVIQEIQGACPDGTSLPINIANHLANYVWPVKIPASLPSCDRCTFAWTWINAIGNREYYMNCADVRIIGRMPFANGVQGSRLRVANLPGYPTEQPPVRNGGPGASRVEYFALNPY